MRAAILGCAGPTLGDGERDFLKDADPFGFILFKRNCETPDQIRTLIAGLRQAVGREAPILIDQEGGRVQRIGPPTWRAAPPAETFGALYARDPERGLEATRLNARMLAEELRLLDITVDCLPVLDLRFADTHAAIGNRAFSGDVETVIALAMAQVEGLRAAGLLPVVKHMPGHGRARVDSHFELPVVDADGETLMATDFATFQALADLPMGMTGHLMFPAFDRDRVSTLSPAVIGEVIRGHIGFDGLLMSDDLSMQALGGSIGERAAGSISAGCDIALHCNGEAAEMEQVIANVPDLADWALVRAEAVVAESASALADAEPLDMDAAASQLEALLDDG
ncbi:MAG: beta-N-acetylhexosaminidase [Rhodospirillaceae bacterium]|nr:beta-N-acetylhexosaminidase [Rhodospirillaceae bacterium]